MVYKVPTTQEVFDRNLTSLESKLNQNSPLSDKAFLRVLAGLEALGYTELNRLAIERVLQAFALTATGDDLDTIGSEYGVIRKPGVATVLDVVIQALDGTTIPTTIYLVGDSNGVRYRVSTTAVASAGFARIEITALDVGTVGDLALWETLTIDTQFAGLLSTTSTVFGTITAGEDRETDDDYRRRVLNEIRTVGGGGNGVDYRTWAESVQGVFRAFPYAGKPIGQGSLPGDRTVFIESTTDIEPDGIPPATLLDTVRDAINLNPTTDLSRPTLGDTNETLFIEPIYRSPFSVEIRGMEIDPALESETKIKIETELSIYMRAIAPYVDGCDAPISRNDVLTNLSISLIVQDIISAAGGSVASIGFGPIAGTFISTYTLGQGELAKVGTINYA